MRYQKKERIMILIVNYRESDGAQLIECCIPTLNIPAHRKSKLRRSGLGNTPPISSTLNSEFQSDQSNRPLRGPFDGSQLTNKDKDPQARIKLTGVSPHRSKKNKYLEHAIPAISWGQWPMGTRKIKNFWCSAVVDILTGRWISWTETDKTPSSKL